MNETKHTPEPWAVAGDGRELVDVNGSGIAHFYAFRDNADDIREAEGSASRAVACVNALAGYDPDAARAVLEACVEQATLQRQLSTKAPLNPADWLSIKIVADSKLDNALARLFAAMKQEPRP